MWWWVWTFAALLFLLAEIHTQALFALFVVLGALVAIAADLIGLPVALQVVAGIVASLLGILLIRPYLWRWMEQSRGNIRLPGQAGSLVGEEAVTLDVVGDANHSGHVYLAGKPWLACVDSGIPTLPKDVPVVVMAVRGTTLVVRPAGPLPAALGY